MFSLWSLMHILYVILGYLFKTSVVISRLETNFFGNSISACLANFSTYSASPSREDALGSRRTRVRASEQLLADERSMNTSLEIRIPIA